MATITGHKHKRIVVSGHLSGAGTEAKLRYFERLDLYLRQAGYKLLLVNLGPYKIHSSCDHVTIPKFLTIAHLFPWKHGVGEGKFSPPLRYAAAVEAEYWQCDLSSATLKIRLFSYYMYRLIRKTNPCLYVLWHQFNGLHIALKALCDNLAIPVVYAEYGVLPGSVVLEQHGQMAESWVARENDKFLGLPVSEPDVIAAVHYLEFVRRNKRSRKKQLADVDVAGLARQCHDKGQMVIFYAGQNDYASGIKPRWAPQSTIHSPFFNDTLDALGVLAKVAEKKNWQIFFKPHPLVQEREENDPHLACSAHVTILRGADIFECMQHADVTTTILSQVSYMSLIHDQPCVLLGRNQLSGKGCLYEIETPGDVEHVLAAAIDAGFTENQKKAWIKHVAQVLRYYVFPFDIDLENLMRRSGGDASRFLIKACISYDANTDRCGWRKEVDFFGFINKRKKDFCDFIYWPMLFFDPFIRLILYAKIKSKRIISSFFYSIIVFLFLNELQ